MICMLTARRIKDGQTDEFLDKFEDGANSIPEDIRDRFKAVYACRDIRDENVILTFGLFDGTLDELSDVQSRSERDEQLENIAPLIDEELFDGSFEVVKEFVEAAATR